MKVEIKFNSWSMTRFRFGVKTATTRTKEYGKPGDTFDIYFPTGISLTDIPVTITYEITDVKRLPLLDVAENYFTQEGCLYPEEFVQMWKKIHFKKGFIPIWRVYLHLFKIKNVKFHFEKGSKPEKERLKELVMQFIKGLAYRNI